MVKNIRIVSVLALALIAGSLIAEPAPPPFAGPPPEEAIPPRIEFQVSDITTGKPLFTGHELLRLSGGLTTKETYYYTAAGVEAQTEVITYDLKTLQTLEYRFDHLPSGEQVRLTVEGDQVRISYREKTGSPVTAHDGLRWKPGTIIGKSLHHIIARGWASLQAGTDLVFDLLVPFKQDIFAFKVKKIGEEAGLSIIRLMPQSWVVQKFVDDMDFYYSDAPPYRLVRYVGTSTIEVDGDRNRKVRIDFKY